MPTVTLARHAMATRFELVLHGDNPVALRAAGEEALDEIDRLEAQLSLYQPGSEIAQLNARAAREAVRVTPELFALLQHARQLHAETGGAFDITIAPLVRCWGFMGAGGKMPTSDEIAEARSKIGMEQVQLNAANHTVRFAHDGVMLDLGAIGKGYAVGQAADILREAGVTSGLIHGGTSTVHAIGQPPDAAFWNIAIEPPSRVALDPTPGLPAAVPLRDAALSVSAVWGRAFAVEGKMYGHVLDPRSGEPVTRALLAVVVLPSATETDALSTALLTLGAEGHDQIVALRPGMQTVLVTPTADGFHTASRGIDLA